MKRPADPYKPSQRGYKAWPGQIKEVDDGSWLISSMNYDPGYIDLEQRP